MEFYKISATKKGRRDPMIHMFQRPDVTQAVTFLERRWFICCTFACCDICSSGVTKMCLLAVMKFLVFYKTSSEFDTGFKN
jgi:hypothetical protein